MKCCLKKRKINLFDKKIKPTKNLQDFISLFYGFL